MNTQQLTWAGKPVSELEHKLLTKHWRRIHAFRASALIATALVALPIGALLVQRLHGPALIPAIVGTAFVIGIACGKLRDLAIDWLAVRFADNMRERGLWHE